MALLGLFFVINGIYNLITNYRGTYCSNLLNQIPNIHCHPDFLSIISSINKINSSWEVVEIQEYLNIFAIITLMVLMFFFRKYQRIVDSAIDMGYQTPKDYTVIVKNIPLSTTIDYHGELRKVFSVFAGNVKLNVRKITLTSSSKDFKDTIRFLDQEIQKKRKSYASRDRDLQNQIEANIAHLEDQLKKVSMQAILDPKCFTGVALISFNTEDGK